MERWLVRHIVIQELGYVDAPDKETAGRLAKQFCEQLGKRIHGIERVETVDVPPPSIGNAA